MKLFIALVVLVGAVYADYDFAPSEGCMKLKLHQHSHSAGAIKNANGGDKKFTDVQCRDACRDEPDCKAVDYRGYDSLCFMHKSETTLIPATADSTGSPSGYRTVSQYRKEGTCEANPDEDCMIHYPGKHAHGAYPIKGADGKERGWTADSCSDYCAGAADCKAVDYVGADTTCHLHTSYQPLIDVTEASTGQVQYNTVSEYRKREGVSVCPGY
ncbi:uncharacterized protein LOC135484959 [Lineus longissimus]|uniref:uncharacterized protein LOC135484959 n=1 Tax=Lineus longissimus TaxID=88925 RepID=UPI002B4D278B